MKIKTSKVHRFGKTITTSAGELTFDENGHTEVSKETFKALKEISSDFEEVGSEGEEKAKAKKKEEDLLEEISNLDEKDLRDLALKVEGATEKVVDKMKKNGLIAYIKKHMPS